MNAPDWLLVYSSDINSKDGEDGIIEKIFGIVGEENRWCVELGALTGTTGSNTRRLIKENGWSSVQIEADPTYFKVLKEEFADNENVTCINSFISFEGDNSLDNILMKTDIPVNFDLLVLDIDGNDYHVWESMEVYRPRVAIIEFNPTIPNEIAFVQPMDMTLNQGSSLRGLVELGKEKGYELVAANTDNAFFVLKELFQAFDMDNSSLDEVHKDKKYITYFFQLYDGTIKIEGNKRMLWHNIQIVEKNLQVLTSGKRRFPNYIDPSDRVRRFKEWARETPIYGSVQKVRKFLKNLF